MLPIRPTSRFKKDLKRAAKQSRNIKKLQQVLEQLAIPAPLPLKHKDHKLKGDWIDFRECHIEPQKRAHSQQLAAGSFNLTGY